MVSPALPVLGGINPLQAQAGAVPGLAFGQSGAASGNPFGAQSPVFPGLQAQPAPQSAQGGNVMSGDTQALFMGLQGMMAGLMGMITTLLMGLLSGAISGQAPAGSGGSAASPLSAGSGSSGSNGSSGRNGGAPALGETTPGEGVTQLSSDKDERMRQLVAEARRVFPNDPVRQKLAVTQAVLESGLLSGGSSLALEHNNLFGIKGEGTAGTVNLGTQEQGSNGLYNTTAGFAKNRTVAESFEQYKDLIGNDRYAGVRSAGSFEEAAQAVKDAGYATDASYVSKLVDLYNGSIAQYFS